MLHYMRWNYYTPMKRNLYGFRFLLPEKEVKLWQKQDESTKQNGECYNGRGGNTERRGN